MGYDAQGRVLSSTNALMQQTTFGVNGAGQIVSVTDPLAKTTTFEYWLGDITVRGSSGAASPGDVHGAPTWFTYDAHEQVTKIIDPRGGETTFTFLPAGGASPPARLRSALAD